MKKRGDYVVFGFWFLVFGFWFLVFGFCIEFSGFDFGFEFHFFIFTKVGRKIFDKNMVNKK